MLFFCTAALRAVRFRWKYGVGFGSQLYADVVVHRDCRREQERGAGDHAGPYMTKGGHNSVKAGMREPFFLLFLEEQECSTWGAPTFEPGLPPASCSCGLAHLGKLQSK